MNTIVKYDQVCPVCKVGLMQEMPWALSTEVYYYLVAGATRSAKEWRCNKCNNYTYCHPLLVYNEKPYGYTDQFTQGDKLVKKVRKDKPVHRKIPHTTERRTKHKLTKVSQQFRTALPIGKQLELTRKNAGVSIQELAKRLKCFPQRVYAIGSMLKRLGIQHTW